MKALAPLFRTDSAIAPMLIRLTFATVMFPHGAQKALGWWGGYGFAGTMKFFTETMNIPWFFALLAVVAEFAGPIALLFGGLTRLAAFGIGVTMSVAMVTVQLPNGFFMNWFGQQKGEGIEFSLLMIGMSLALIVSGGGRWSLDGIFAKKANT